MSEYIDIVFDGPPGHEAGRFVEVENDRGHGISVGDWIKRPDGYWALRIPNLAAQVSALKGEIEFLKSELAAEYSNARTIGAQQ